MDTVRRAVEGVVAARRRRERRARVYRFLARLVAVGAILGYQL